MKKKILSLCFFGVYLFSFGNIIYAESVVNNAAINEMNNADWQALTTGESVWWGSSSSARWGNSWGATTVTVTEKIPGMDCTGTNEGDITKRRYVCTIQPGFGSVMLILKGLIKYTTFLVALIGVLMLVVSGVQYSMSGADDGAAKDAKTRIQKVLVGIVLLFLIGFILNSVAPWVYR